MADLKQAKAGHYFYVTNLGKGPVTRQLYPKGVEYLLDHGVRVGEEIPAAIIGYLRKNHLSYTKGEQSREDFEHVEVGDELYPSDATELTMFMTGDSPEDMQLLLRYPHMPAEDFSELQRNCGVSCEGLDRSVELLAFDAYELAVQPREDHYDVTTYGDWGTVSAQPWKCGAAGLASDGEVFALRHAEWRRQSNGARLLWGEPIRIVRKAKTQISCVQIQDSATRLGQVGGDWIVEKFTMPTKHDLEVKSWLEERDISVFDTSPKIVFLSMPSAVVDGQVPRFDGEVMVWINEINSFRESKVFVESAKGDAEICPLTLKNSSQAMLKIPEMISGDYVLKVKTDHLVSRKFSVGQNKTRNQFPSFLHMRIGGKEFCGSTASTMNELVLASADQIPEVHIASPRSVSWQWSGLEGLLTDSSHDPNFAAQCLSKDMDLIRTTPGSSATLVLEAGAFGKISVHISGTHPAKIAREVSPALHIECKQDNSLKLRWLESVISKRRDPIGLRAHGHRQVSAIAMHTEWIRRLSGDTEKRGRVK